MHDPIGDAEPEGPCAFCGRAVYTVVGRTGQGLVWRCVACGEAYVVTGESPPAAADDNSQAA